MGEMQENFHNGKWAYLILIHSKKDRKVREREGKDKRKEEKEN